MLAWHAPCHIHQRPQDRKEERKMCGGLLTDRVSLAAFGLGVVCWSAAYALRPAIWKTIEVVSRLAQISQLGSGTLANGLATFFFLLLKTTLLEFLRLFSVLLGNSLIFAGLLRIPTLDRDLFHDPQDLQHRSHKWTLHWYDPRFTIAVWVAIGWASTEFLVTSWQWFDRLALYEVDFEEEITNDVEAYVPPQDGKLRESALQQHRLQMSDSDTGADYSDSAATVRGESKPTSSANQEVSTGVASGVDTLSPGAKLLEARRRVLTAAEESGFSIPRSDAPDDEAEELGALREKLDVEMDALNKARSRVELEATFGQPLTSIPIVLCTLWRIDGYLWNLGSTLLMSASVTIAQGPFSGQHFPPIFPPLHLTITTLTFLIALHTLFTSLWTTGLPTFGFAFVTYASMLAGVGLIVSASARWGLLV
ncbi:uncharacterized protein FA14DRAFT_169987 [Meira miltonrushii]|uniref:Uncharacterized protein n=1 Tax=Meira miltonrushii TaxID=1280837 RepID=A0A316VHI2_9BASI|nr:uncharacterized protein FA14DRAFT_169987 [Meira miltonrushii]PWN37099.1 hypothetical protein FA14DRAFT_169987 [Meira miltonrushii]